MQKTASRIYGVTRAKLFLLLYKNRLIRCEFLQDRL
jgi:hypothetical protein